MGALSLAVCGSRRRRGKETLTSSECAGLNSLPTATCVIRWSTGFGGIRRRAGKQPIRHAMASLFPVATNTIQQNSHVAKRAMKHLGTTHRRVDGIKLKGIKINK